MKYLICVLFLLSGCAGMGSVSPYMAAKDQYKVFTEDFKRAKTECFTQPTDHGCHARIVKLENIDEEIRKYDEYIGEYPDNATTQELYAKAVARARSEVRWFMMKTLFGF